MMPTGVYTYGTHGGTIMRSISVRELRSKSAQVWRELASEQDLVIRSNGKPIAILSSTTEETLEESVTALQRARSTLSLMRAQMDSVRKGTSKMPFARINQIISGVRKARAK